MHTQPYKTTKTLKKACFNLSRNMTRNMSWLVELVKVRDVVACTGEEGWCGECVREGTVRCWRFGLDSLKNHG